MPNPSTSRTPSPGRRRPRPPILAALVVLTLLAARPATADLAGDIGRRLAEAGGRWSVVVQDLRAPAAPPIVAGEPPEATFRAASTMKMLVLAKIFSDVRAGAYALTTPVRVHEDFASAAGGRRFRVRPKPGLRARFRASHTVAELLEWMLGQSDNLSANLLIEQAGGLAAVDEFGLSLGWTASRTRRLLLDRAAMDAGQTNLAAAGEYAALLGRAARGELIDAETSRRFLDALFGVKRGWIGRKLPRSVRVAHKPGRLIGPGVRNDAALIEQEGGPRYTLCILSEGVPGARGGEGAISDISLLVWRHMKRRADEAAPRER